METKQMNIECPICYGDGWIFETHDADSRHKEACPCQAKWSTMDHMVATGYADAMDAEALANRGCDDVLSHSQEEVKQQVWEELKKLREVQPYAFTADDLRRRVDKAVLGKLHNNAIGALFRKASSRGLIEWTGQMAKSSHKASHGRLIRVWRRG